jgi:hypothetical protein
MQTARGWVAAEALESYRIHVDEIGLPDDAARRRAVDGARDQVTSAPGRIGHVSAPVDRGDLDRVTGEQRRLLGRVAAAETALSRMEREHAAVVDAVIGLFVEYRDVHGYADEGAGSSEGPCRCRRRPRGHSGTRARRSRSGVGGRHNGADC